jgi:N-acetylglucosamine-6-phosphate deacetylase
MKLVARDYRDSRWIELEVRDGVIAAIESCDGSSAVNSGDLWVAPAFYDIQLNGGFGHSFSSPDLTVENVAAIVRTVGRQGTARLCPTLITAPIDHLIHGLRTIAAACDAYSDVAERVAGIHLEGPFISLREGFRGAHAPEWTRDPDWNLFGELQEAAGQRIVLITLAPERTGAIEFIRRATTRGVVVALGHTAADGATIRAANAAGARLSTHLGNGIASLLPRHPNPIWEQAALDELAASFIADGHHLDLATLRVLARAKGPEGIVLISDASPLAGLPPGTYGEWAVDPSGKIVVAGTPYLAGSNEGLAVGLGNLLAATGCSLPEAVAAVTLNPARLLGLSPPQLAAGESADLVIFTRPDRNSLVLKRVCVSGRWELD